MGSLQALRSAAGRRNGHSAVISTRGRTCRLYKSQSLRAIDPRNVDRRRSQEQTAQRPRRANSLAGNTAEGPRVSPKHKPHKTVPLVERVRTILASKNLTLHQASRTSETLYGKPSPFFLPHNFYYNLGLDTFTPSLYQLLALSRISNYRLPDWMQLFGFDLSNVTRLQVLLHSNRTTLLDPSLDDPNSWVLWFRGKTAPPLLPDVFPLGKLLEYSVPRRVASVSAIDSHKFLYAKLGSQDDFAFPDLIPGSIVRVNSNLTPEPLGAMGRISDRCFLIEHSKGFCCCRIQPSGKDRIILISNQLPYAQTELRIPQEGKILGVVDLEIRPLLRSEQPEISKDLARPWSPAVMRQSEIKLGQLLSQARTRMAMSFREASTLTRQIANILRDEQYFASPGSLSDYEALDAPPRHVHKAITLCAIYGLKWSQFLNSAGLDIGQTGIDFISDELLGRLSQPKTPPREEVHGGENQLLDDLIRAWDGEIPLFLRGSLDSLSGLPNFSLHDVFWIERAQTSLGVHLAGGFMAIVNRRKKKPLHEKSKPLWQQPIYVVLKRDGTFVCAFCSFENGTLVLHSYAQGYHRSERLRNRQDAEIVGQIVAIARRVS